MKETTSDIKFFFCTTQTQCDRLSVRSWWWWCWGCDVGVTQSRSLFRSTIWLPKFCCVVSVIDRWSSLSVWATARGKKKNKKYGYTSLFVKIIWKSIETKKNNKVKKNQNAKEINAKKELKKNTTLTRISV